MRFLATVLSWAAAAAVVAGDAVNDLEDKGRPALEAHMAKSKTCTKENLRIRKEWGDLTKDERRAYIDGVLCLLKLPSKLDQTQFPGAHSRYDDFVVVHMNQTLQIHGTGNFLSWHRYYVWRWESVMRDECGYKGTQPYWNYGKWAEDPLGSPLFDGSDSSLGGNGAKTERAGGGGGGGFGGGFGGGGFSPAPAGDGGGCVTTGPFKNMTVYLGPMSAVVQPAPARNPQANGYGSNPRCLRRDITNYLSTRFGKTADIVKQITNYEKILAFQNFMQGGSGVHGVGHFTVSGDPGGDFYISPNEPSFWLHHAMIDRIWTIWQSQDYDTRMMAMEGGTSMMGGGRQQTLEDPIDLGVVADKAYQIKDMMSSVDGPMCYMYQ